MSGGILVVGSLNMDLSVSMTAMPAKGETVLGESLSYQVGGKGANQACAAGKLNGRVKMLGCVGEDEFGKRQIESLEASGVEASCLKRSRERPTGMAFIYVDRHGDNSIVVVPGANRDCDVSYLKEQEELFRWCDYVVLQMEIPEDAVLYAAQKAKKEGKTVILNPAPAPDELPDELLEMVDYITPNETELHKLSGRDAGAGSVGEAAEYFIKKGVKHVIVTLGEKGAMLVNKQEKVMFAAGKVQGVDTTAAGDCFNGAFAVGLAEGLEPGEAIKFANRAAAVAVTRRGAVESLPWRDEVLPGDALREEVLQDPWKDKGGVKR